jgi:hypothetical protein
MRCGIILLAALIGMVTLPDLQAGDSDARDIMEKVDARDDGDNAVSEMEMVLIDRRGGQRLRKIRSYTRNRGKDTLQVMFFLHPPDVEGTGFLTYDYNRADQEDDQWLYLPALHKTKRIATSGKSGSFMGSDFNYSDLTTRDLDDFDYTIIKESEVGGAKVWVIEAVPRTEQVIEETGYSKSLLLVRQDNYVVVRAVRWLDNGQDLRYLDIKKLELIDGIWVGTEIHMTTKRNQETRHKTILKLDKVSFGQQLSDDLFTVGRLEKGP